MDVCIRRSKFLSRGITPQVSNLAIATRENLLVKHYRLSSELKMYIYIPPGHSKRMPFCLLGRKKSRSVPQNNDLDEEAGPSLKDTLCHHNDAILFPKGVPSE